MTAERKAGARSCQAPGPGAGSGIEKYPAGATGSRRTEATRETKAQGARTQHLPGGNGAISVSAFLGLKICMLQNISFKKWSGGKCLVL